MTNLTEQWKRGKLEKDKKYYTKDKLGRIYVKTYNKRGFKGLVEEVLCEVPSYEEWQAKDSEIDFLQQKISVLESKNLECTENICVGK